MMVPYTRTSKSLSPLLIMRYRGMHSEMVGFGCLLIWTRIRLQLTIQ